MRRRVGLALVLTISGAAAPLHAEGDPFLRRTTTVRVVERTGPAVVNVTTEQRAPEAANPFQPFAGDPIFDRFFQDFFEPREPRAEQSLGSGVLIDAQRHVLTNEHVITRAERIRVTLADGREFGGKLIGADPNNDIAVLEVETQEKLPWTPPGSSGDLMVGEPVIAIGNPFGLSHTVTTGVISALGRSLRTDERVYHGFIQTDASINPGNSGGPLLNAEGHLIAINTAVYNRAQGIGFAIPIDDARRVVRELIDHGEVSPVWLGIDLQDLDAGLVAALELPSGAHGAVVSPLRPNSPAERAGVKRGDVVTHVDGQPLESARDFFERLERTTPGQDLSLTAIRNREKHDLAVRAEQIPKGYVATLVSELLGLSLEPVPRGGFAVSAVRAGSGAAQIGLRRGDVLLAIGGPSRTAPGALRPP